MPITYINGTTSCPAGRFALVASRFNKLFTDRLLEGAIDALRRTGGVSDERMTVVMVPGAIELALAADRLAASGGYDAIIAVGCVVRGGTYHFEVVANESAKCLAQVALQHRIPVINAVLTVDSIDQAIERAGAHLGNKGAEAAVAALEMVSVLSQL